MKRIVLVVAIIALLTPATSSGAFSIFAGYWDTADLGESEGLGMRLGIKLLPSLELELGGSYYNTFERRLTLGGLDLVTNLEVEVIPIDAGVRFDFGLPGGLYLSAGASLFLLDADIGNLDDEVGFYGTVGYRFARKIFMEAVYREVDGTVENLELGDVELTDDFKVDLGGLTLNLGFRF